MVRVKTTKKIAKIILELMDERRYNEVLAFISNAQEAAIEARSVLTKEQLWDLFTALQEYKCLIDELANRALHNPPCGLGLFREDVP